MLMFSSTVRSMSLVSACGITPITRRASSGSLATSWPAIRAAPAGDRDQCRHHADEGRLSCAIRAEQPEDLSFLYVEGDVVHGCEVAVFFDDVVNFDRIRDIGRGDGRAHSRNTTIALAPLSRASTLEAYPVQLFLRNQHFRSHAGNVRAVWDCRDELSVPWS